MSKSGKTPSQQAKIKLSQQRAADEAKARRKVLITSGIIAAVVITLALTVFLWPKGQQAGPVTTVEATTQPSSTTSPNSETTANPQSSAANALTNLVGSHKLNDVTNPKAVFVEFLDFECEACAGALPAIEQLKETYGDRVSFETRYFPLQSHFNSMYAARAAEAAAQQGKYYEMLTLLYKNQSAWGEKQAPEEETFRGYARELGLDMTKWEADYNSEATLKLIQADIQLGDSIGVESTPSFFLKGERLEPRTMQDLIDAFDRAVQ